MNQAGPHVAPAPHPYETLSRIPDHEAIFAGWARDAAAFRAESPPRVFAYGPGERERIDLFEPAGARGATVAFFHGGWWQRFDPSWFSHLARGLAARGFRVALPGYDLCPAVPLSKIVDQARQACRALDEHVAGPIVAAGHSAGGHLAACLLATEWEALGPKTPRVTAAYAISGLFDLQPLVETPINQGLRLDAAEARRLSPLFWSPPSGRTLDAVVGGEEAQGFFAQARAVEAVWGGAGAEVRVEAIDGAHHLSVVAPLSDPDSAMVARLAELALG